jgi:hypothetical protein
MIVHHPDRLHKGIADRRADKSETPFFQPFAHCSRFGSLGGKFLHRLPGIYYRLPPDKAPDKPIKTAEFLLHFQKCPGVGNGRFDFQPIADYAGIFEKILYFNRIIFGDFLGGEIVEDLTVVLAAVENRLPRQTGLRPLENKEFESKWSSCTGTPHSVS